VWILPTLAAVEDWHRGHRWEWLVWNVLYAPVFVVTTMASVATDAAPTVFNILDELSLPFKIALGLGYGLP
jgi:hypothetical protein